MTTDTCTVACHTKERYIVCRVSIDAMYHRVSHKTFTRIYLRVSLTRNQLPILWIAHDQNMPRLQSANVVSTLLNAHSHDTVKQLLQKDDQRKLLEEIFLSGDKIALGVSFMDSIQKATESWSLAKLRDRLGHSFVELVATVCYAAHMCRTLKAGEQVLLGGGICANITDIFYDAGKDPYLQVEYLSAEVVPHSELDIGNQLEPKRARTSESKVPLNETDVVPDLPAQRAQTAQAPGTTIRNTELKHVTVVPTTDIRHSYQCVYAATVCACKSVFTKRAPQDAGSDEPVFDFSAGEHATLCTPQAEAFLLATSNGEKNTSLLLEQIDNLVERDRSSNADAAFVRCFLKRISEQTVLALARSWAPVDSPNIVMYQQFTETMNTLRKMATICHQTFGTEEPLEQRMLRILCGTTADGLMLRAGLLVAPRFNALWPDRACLDAGSSMRPSDHNAGWIFARTAMWSVSGSAACDAAKNVPPKDHKSLTKLCLAMMSRNSMCILTDTDLKLLGRYGLEQDARGRTSLDIVAACHYAGASVLESMARFEYEGASQGADQHAPDKVVNTFVEELFRTYREQKIENLVPFLLAAERVSLHTCGPAAHFREWDTQLMGTHRILEAQLLTEQPQRLFASEDIPSERRIVFRAEMNRTLRTTNEYIGHNTERMNIAIISSLAMEDEDVALYAQWLVADDTVRGDGGADVTTGLDSLMLGSSASPESALTYRLLERVDRAIANTLTKPPIEVSVYNKVDWHKVDAALVQRAFSIALNEHHGGPHKQPDAYDAMPILQENIAIEAKPVVPKTSEAHRRHQFAYATGSFVRAIKTLNASKLATDAASQSVLKAIEDAVGVVPDSEMHLIESKYRREIGGGVCVIAWPRSVPSKAPVQPDGVEV